MKKGNRVPVKFEDETSFLGNIGGNSLFYVGLSSNAVPNACHYLETLGFITYAITNGSAITDIGYDFMKNGGFAKDNAPTTFIEVPYNDKPMPPKITKSSVIELTKMQKFKLILGAKVHISSAYSDETKTISINWKVK
jgi:hypothetical protein